MHVTPGNVCSRKFGGEAERAIGRRTRLRVCPLSRRALEVLHAEKRPGPRQPAPGERIARIKLSGLCEGLDRLPEIGFRLAGKIKLALKKGVLGLKPPTRGWLALRCPGLTR